MFIGIVIAAILIWFACTMSAQAMYAPDGNTHIINGSALVEYSVPQKDISAEIKSFSHYMICQFTIYNLTTNHPDHNVNIRLVADHFIPNTYSDRLETFYPNNNATKRYMTSIPALQNAVFHFMISPGINNPSPKLGIKCWIF